MMQLLHILLAVVLTFPLGLFEHQSCWPEFSGSTCVIAEVDQELLQVSSAPDSEPQGEFFHVVRSQGFAWPVLRFAPECELLAVEMGCVLLHGCRPPPFSARCC